jgi:predicted secreted protein
MTLFSGAVLFGVIWFLALLAILPLGVRTQGEDGRVVRGTPSSAPTEAKIRRKLAWATLLALLIWAPIAATILWSGLGIRDIDFWGRM